MKIPPLQSTCHVRPFTYSPLSSTPFNSVLFIALAIESQESTVRLPTLQLDSNPLDLDASSTWIPQSLQMPRWTNTLYHYWRRSLFHVCISFIALYTISVLTRVYV